MQETREHEQVALPDKKRGTITKKLATVFLLVAVFSVGWLSGDGRIQIAGLERFSTNSASYETINQSGEISTEGLEEIFSILKQKYDGEIDAAALSQGLKEGLVSAIGDTYTEYLSPEDTEEFNSSLNGTFEGIGAELSKEENVIIIVAPIKGAPAEKAGLLPQDIIIEIDGELATDITVSEAVKRIRGEKGTEVVLTIIRNGEQLEFTIVRDTIDIDSVEWREEDGIGIIELARFSDDTTELVAQAANEFSEQGIKNIILDMRGNPGGLLDQAITVSNIWLPKGTTVLEEKRGGEVIKTFQAQDTPIFKDVKTIVLINEGSASASEIVAGALKDNDYAELYGATSFGKGSVQQLVDLKSGGALKVTIARWYTPNGKNIDKEGIEPDVAVEITPEDREAQRDPQLDAAKAAF